MTDISDYEAAKRREQIKAYDLPLRGVIKEVLGETETIKVSSFGTTGAPEFAVRHPFLGIKSWIRAMPEAGTTILTQRRGDLDQQEVWGYISHQLAAVAKVALKDRSVPFRILHAGEIDIMSRGMSAAYFGDAGDLELRGGMVSQTLSHSTLEHDSIAPTFHRRLHNHDPVLLGHEERFGAVRRMNPVFPNSMTRILQNLDGSFPMEYGRWLTSTNLLGLDLVTLQEGSAVYDEIGLETFQTSTNRTLRHKRTFYHQIGGELTFEVDADLNIFMRNKSTAVETKLDFGTVNNVDLRMAKLKVVGLKSAQFNFNQSLYMAASSIRHNSSNIGFGSSPSQQAVLGPPLVSTVLTPLFSLLQIFFNVMGNDGVLLGLGSPSSLIAQIAAKVIEQTMQNINTILSTQVKLTA